MQWLRCILRCCQAYQQGREALFFQFLSQSRGCTRIEKVALLWWESSKPWGTLPECYGITLISCGVVKLIGELRCRSPKEYHSHQYNDSCIRYILQSVLMRFI